MKSPTEISRRDFFKISLTGAGLAIGFSHSGCADKSALNREPEGFSPNIYLKISADNQVTLMVTESEMGQGVWTSLPMLIAEELQIDWTEVRVEQAPLRPELRDNITWGSASIRKAWVRLRQAGAIARQMLISAAAEHWHVPASECVARQGTVFHDASGKFASYGELAGAASRLPIPEQVVLKAADKFETIGTSKPMLDAPAKAKGSAVFGIDVKLDGMLIATVTHCPVFGGRLTNLDADDALNVPGVRYVMPIEAGVAVVADHFWAAIKGRDALKLQWDPGQHARLDSVVITDTHAQAILGDAEILQQSGEPQRHQGRTQGINRLQATYESPFQAHATMEPMCCTADVRADGCDIWVPTQAPGLVQRTAARMLLSQPELLLERIKLSLTGDSLDTIKVHTTFLGGAFGRRYEQDFVAEAVQISQAVTKPVKLVWTREEDMQHDFYRPYTRHQVSADIDAKGKLLSWKHRIAGPGRHLSSGGSDLPYATEHYQLEYIETHLAVPVGYWRSVGSSHNVFVIESFIDELAQAAGDDSYSFRRRLLSDTPRLRAVLDLAAKKADWGRKPPEGLFRGLSLNMSHGSYVAMVVEISIDRSLQIHRVVCAVDCGQVINPDIVRAQMEGSIVFGLTACIKSEITIERGRVKQSNFHDFPLLRMDEMPEIETFIVASHESPGGVGEPGVPPVAPAVVNAIHAATGVRIRKLPIKLDGLVE